ncbi:MAG: hypothetical protein JOZ41_08645 [Chloroflexi bacterium]|nr:hypothetical protein [Chloroflexota bacterium]
MRRLIVLAVALILLVLPPPGPARRVAAGVFGSWEGGGVSPGGTRPVRGPVVRIPLRVSLEWSTVGTPAMAEWRIAVERAAAFLEGATDGQATISPIVVTDNAQGWAQADVRVYAHNTGIPNATVGGIATPNTVTSLSPSSSISSGGLFAHGAINLGRSWSEWGPRRGRWTDPDGFSTIVHELGHYAFYLYDEYYRYVDTAPPAPATPNPRPPAHCALPGTAAAPTPTPDASLMYWEYSRRVFWAGSPTGGCKLTLQWEVYGQTDWEVIHAHYPAMTPPTSYAPPPPPPPCPPCGAPAANRWLLGLTKPDAQADAYLIKAGAKRVLHEGVPYPNDPRLCLTPPATLHPLPHTDPLAPCTFYPPGRLEIVGGAKGDVVRVTLTAPHGGTLQAVQPLTGIAGSAALTTHKPAWYGTPTPHVPVVDAAPLLTTVRGATKLVGLSISATNPQSTPLIVGHGLISATLFEAGRGRQAFAYLHYAGAGISGGGTYAGKLGLGNPPILDGSLYLTPRGRGHEKPGKPGQGAWALAYLSISCNSPTDFLPEYAPGDEGGLDSGDGVVNVHLTTSGLSRLCVGFAAQPGDLPSGITALSAAYAVRGSTPLPRRQTIVTLHLDRDLQAITGGGSPLITYAPLPGTVQRGKSRPCRLTAISDSTAGTVTAITIPSGTADGVYQAVAASPTAVSTFPLCSGGSGTLPQIKEKAAQ